MKKIILSVVAVLAFGFANAQDIKSSKGENYLPEAGDWAIGYNADGLFNYVGNAFNKDKNAAPSVGAQMTNTFVGKKFTSANEAYRVMANFAVNSGTTGDALTPDGETKISGFALQAGLGKEWRRGKTRLQGFYGADVFLSISSTKDTNTTIVAGVSDAMTDKSSSFGVGAQGFIGAEYFLFPKISIGAQYTYGLVINSTTATYSETGAPDVKAKTSGFNLGNVGVSSINMTLHF